MFLVHKFTSFLPYYELSKLNTALFYAVEDAALKDLSNDPQNVSVS